MKSKIAERPDLNAPHPYSGASLLYAEPSKWFARYRHVANFVMGDPDWAVHSPSRFCPHRTPHHTSECGYFVEKT